MALACWLVLAPIAARKDVSAAPSMTRRPNMLIIFTDDMGYGDIAILNRDSRIPTPNLDRLANESLIFTDARSAESYCVPSRYGLLTSRYIWRTRLGSVGNLAEMLNIKLNGHTAQDGQSFFKALTGKSRPTSFHEAIVTNLACWGGARQFPPTNKRVVAGHRRIHGNFSRCQPV